MASTSSLIVIDGSHGEGGGALLRTALVMSALTQQGLRINNVRGGTRHPNLDSEDLTLLHALARICKADVVGGEIGSSNVTFLPKSRPTHLNGAIECHRNEQGRGPNALVVLNALLPVLARTGFYSTVVVEGETYGFNSLSYDYFANVTLEALKKAGLYAFPDLLRPGFGRDSDGEVSLDVEPSALQGIEWADRGSLRSVSAIVATCNVSPSLADRALAHLKNMAQHAGLPLEAEHVDYQGKQPGAFVTLWTRYERGFGGGTAMGSKGLKAETLAHAAFEQATKWMSTSATVDEYVADQLLLPLCLAEGPSVLTVPVLTQRLLTSIWVVKQFTPIRITVRGLETGPGTITIHRG